MRAALARHDIGWVYRSLKRRGISQQRIASATGQAQPHVSAVMRGHQTVQAYGVLSRIADGLGIPRGYMGLSFDPAVRPKLSPPRLRTEDDDVDRREFIASLAGLVISGVPFTRSDAVRLAASPAGTPVPARVGATDVGQVRLLTGGLRAFDARHGGGACREAILAHTRWADSLLHAACTDEIRRGLLAAVADAKTLAGWTAHDLALHREARDWMRQAVQHTRDARDPAHSAIVLYHLGRAPLDNGHPADALQLFQIGQIAAQNSGSRAATSLLLANQAIAYAHLDEPGQALDTLDRAEHEFGNADRDRDAEFLRFYDRGALSSMAARVHSRLGITDPAYRETALDRLHTALAAVPAERARQRAFNMILQAATTLSYGNVADGVTLGRQALDAVRPIRSPRLASHLTPLVVETANRDSDSDVRQLHAEAVGLIDAAA